MMELGPGLKGWMMTWNFLDKGLSDIHANGGKIISVVPNRLNEKGDVIEFRVFYENKEVSQ